MNTVTKSEVNAELKNLGLCYVSVVSDIRMMTNKTKTLLNSDGKRFKGISAGSIGPLTVTNAYREKNAQVLGQIQDTLKDLGLVHTEIGLFIANRGTKKEFSVTVNEGLFPSYSRSLGYDPAYQQFWYLVKVI